MAKPEWGRKRICPSCGTKYYDFKNEEFKNLKNFNLIINFNQENIFIF